MNREQAKVCAELSYIELIRSGVTSFVDYTSVRHTSEAFIAAQKFGLRGNIGKTMMDKNSPAELLEDTDESLRATKLLLTKWHHAENDRLRYNITPRFCNTCSDELLLGCKEIMKKYDVLFTTHANENRNEINTNKKSYGVSAIKHLDKLGLLGKRTLLVHCVWLNENEIKLLAKTKTNVAHCPGSNMMLGSGCAPIIAIVKSSINIGSEVIWARITI